MRNLSLSCSILLVEAICAQRPADAASGEGPPAAVSVMRRSFGAFVVDGETCAAGPDYAARFVASGIEFTPALGERAPRRLPVSFALESIRRGTDTILSVQAPVAPDLEGNFVRYARGAGIVESYEARVDGVEQTFRFESLPEGTGDLVVRGKVTTELPVSAADPSLGIRFEVPGLGGVSWGAVTGIDARGARVAGNLRLDGEHLELALPGEFVDQAAFPLLLDPLIGAIITVIGGATDDYAPDVSYDLTYARYLVVWHRRYSSTNRAVFGQRMTWQGALVGSVIGLTVTNGNFRSPSVANVNASDRFVVVYETDATVGADYYTRAVNASDGAVSLFIRIGGTERPAGFDVAGDSRGQGDLALVAYRFFYPGSFPLTPSYDTVWALQVRVPPSPGTPVLVGRFDSFFNIYGRGIGRGTAPRITRHGGVIGRYLVICQHDATSVDRDVYGMIVSPEASNGPITSSPQSISATTVDEAAPDCATRDGSRFAIVYERRAGGPTGNSDVACRTLTYLPPTTSSPNGTWAIGAERIVAGGVEEQVTPAVDFAAAKYIVAWASFSNPGGAWNLYTMGLDPNGCVPCEHVTAIDSSAATADYAPKIAATYSASPTTSDEAMVVWDSTETSSDVKAQRVQAIGGGGTVTGLGGGCGPGGTAGANGPFALGNPDFAFTLSGNSAPAFGMMLGVSTVNMACGPCTQVPSADVLYIGPPPYSLPIPCNTGLIGLPLHAQWLVLAPGGCPLAPFLSVSQAVRVVLGT